MDSMWAWRGGAQGPSLITPTKVTSAAVVPRGRPAPTRPHSPSSAAESLGLLLGSAFGASTGATAAAVASPAAPTPIYRARPRPEPG